MRFSFTHHRDPDDLRQIQLSFSGNPKFLFLYHSIKFELERLYPSSTFKLYSCISGKATYWFGLKSYSHLKVNDVLVAYEGEFDSARYAEAFAKYADVNDVFITPLLVVGEMILVEEVVKYVQGHLTGFFGHKHPTKLFYMTEAQMEAVKNLELPPLPDGYKLGSSDPTTDSEFITSHWRHAKQGDVEETRLFPLVVRGYSSRRRAKLTCFPSSCIRYEGKPVAFEMMSQSGSLNHLFVLEQHRRKGLGQIVELDLAKKAIRLGLKVNKNIELFNESLIDSTSRSPFWTKAKQEDGSDYINLYYVLEFE
ncbi:hypothetical protein ANCCAN_00786 [Ancylostoma caninum]|uniref:Glycine N-acyltransferase-like protein n=1 Tax=Ancylostoma caninum TaxID=29170 RepID=A0A368HD21_ANCCA|nr:hypothetical protein ANCCAN_00786 [Ancylostoma caninum]